MSGAASATAAAGAGRRRLRAARGSASGTLCYGGASGRGDAGTPGAPPGRAAPRLHALEPALHPLAPGDVLPGTRLVVRGLLGQGGMGEVYEVEHAELGRRFAVKLLHRLHRDRPDLAARMREEARSIGRLRHRHLVEVFDLGVTRDGRTYFAMELLEGRDLRAELARVRAVAVPTALRLAEQALEALAAVHDAGIVHRDVKLENLFLCDDGVLKLLDFGVAKLDRGGAFHTAEGALVGTPRTMAPEQCRPGPVDARADLYALGLALYELVAGRGPFDDLRGQPDALRFAHCDRTPPPPSRLALQPIPPGVERLVLCALEKSPERRFQSAREMAAAIRRALGAPVGPLRRSPPELTPALDRSDAPHPAPGLDATEVDLSPRPAAPAPRARAARPRAVLPRRARLTSGGGSRPVAPGARHTIVGLCALAVASAALALSRAQRLPALPPPALAPAHVEARATSAVR